MAHIGRGKCVLLILSEQYLKSENCLFELLEVAKHGDSRRDPAVPGPGQGRFPRRLAP